MSRKTSVRREVEDVEALLGKSSRWAMSYGDLMSSLMILFLMLYSFSTMGGLDGEINIDKFQQAFGAESSSYLANKIKQINLEEDIAEDIRGYIKSNNLSEYAVIKVDEYKIKIMLTQAVMFDMGQSKLKDQSKAILTRLANMLESIDNNIVIEGHTDDIPIKGGSNFELAAQRAMAVLRFFNGKGIAADRISIAGYGPYKPLVENNSEANRRKNRRVEINIIRSHADLMETY